MASDADGYQRCVARIINFGYGRSEESLLLEVVATPNYRLKLSHLPDAADAAAYQYPRREAFVASIDASTIIGA